MVTLGENLMGRGLRQLGRSADGAAHAYLSLSLPKKNLSNIDYIATFTSLQNVDLQENALSSLTALNPLIHLRSLNVSHNQLTELLAMRAPRALAQVDCSHNRIASIATSLAPHRYLTRLNIASNTLKNLDGVQLCPSLIYIDASQNQVGDISHINNSNLTHLLLADNAIADVSLQLQPNLRVLDLSHNMVVSLDGLDIKRVPLLSTLRLPFNRIESLDEMHRLSSLEQLRELDLRGNAITKLPNYRFQLLFILPRLVLLDGVRVTAEEVVDAANFHGLDGAAREAILHRYLPYGSHTRPADAHAPPPSASLAASAAVAAAAPLPFSLAACLSLSSSARLAPIAPSLAATSPSGVPLGNGATIGGNKADVPNRVAALVSATLPASVVRTSPLAGLKLPEDKYWSTAAEKGFVGEWTQFLNGTANMNASPRVDLSNIAAGDVGWWALAQCLTERKTVESLDLSSSVNTGRWTSLVGDYYGFRALVRAVTGSRLREVIMERCSIGHESAPLLAELIRACAPTLRVLRLAHNQLGEHVHALATSSDAELPVEHCPGLRAICRAVFGASLDGSGNSSGNVSSHGGGIIELDLSHNNLDHRAGAVLAECLPRGRLQSLNLSANPFGENGGSGIMDALKSQTSLRVLIWQGGEQQTHKLPSSIMVAIGRLLSRPDDQIAYLDVSHNISTAASPTKSSSSSPSSSSHHESNGNDDHDEDGGDTNGDEGCISIAMALTRRPNPSPLTHLDISNCGVASRGVRALARALQANNTLTSLAMMNAVPSSSSLTVFFWSLLRNASLRSLDLTGVAIYPDVAPRLADVIKRCPFNTIRIGATPPSNGSATSGNTNGSNNAAPSSSSFNKLDEASWVAIADAIATSENNHLTDLSLRGVGGELSWRVIAACSSVSLPSTVGQAISPGGGTIMSPIGNGLSAIGASLRRLHAGGGTWTATSWMQLSAAIRKLPSVTELSLAGAVLPPTNSENPSSSVYVTELLQAVLANTSIASLDLTSVYLGSEGALGLADGLADNTSLRYLVLDRCALTDGRAGDNGMVTFARSLSQDQTLFSLSLRGQNQPFSYAMLTGLVSSLSGNRTLAVLDLSDNTVPYSTDHCQLFTWMLQASTSIRGLKLPSFLVGDNGLPHSYRGHVCTTCGMRDPNAPAASPSSSPTNVATAASITAMTGGLTVPSSGAFAAPVTPRLVLPPQATTASVSMVPIARGVETKSEAKAKHDDDTASVDGASITMSMSMSHDSPPVSTRCTASANGTHRYDDGVCRFCGTLQDIDYDVSAALPIGAAATAAAAAAAQAKSSKVSSTNNASICAATIVTSAEAQSRRDTIIACFALGLEKNNTLVELDIGASFPLGLTPPQSRSLYGSICGGALRRRLRTLTASSRPIVTLLPASDVKPELLSGDQADNAIAAQLAANRVPQSGTSISPSPSNLSSLLPQSDAQPLRSISPTSSI